MPAPSRDLIRGVPLFAETDEKFLGRLAEEFNPRTYAPGDLMAEEGERGRTFFVIESGEVSTDDVIRVDLLAACRSLLPPL